MDLRPAALFDKIWDAHVIHMLDDGVCMLHVDRHVIYEAASGPAFRNLKRDGRTVFDPGRTYAVMDHILSTAPGRNGETFQGGREFVQLMRQNAAEHNISLFDVGHPWQGITHVISPELGIALPGLTVACADSHTATCGGLGALSWGIGTSELEHVLATQTTLQRKPMRMRAWFAGSTGPGVYAKDLILYLIGQEGIAAGRGHAIEYAGPAIQALEIEGRLTICNMSIELGSRSGLIGPDDKTYRYLQGRPFAPSGPLWDRALEEWRRLPTEDGSTFDKEVWVDACEIEPQVTWGVTQQEVISVGEAIPDPAHVADAAQRTAMERALRYQGIAPGRPLEGTPIDIAFIGSCTNSRLSDLDIAAKVVRGRKVASHVRALVVPGSMQVKRDAEAKGLHTIFLEAGFEWREPGCSMCIAINDDVVPPGKRCIATSNRNFEDRQGTGARTHLASPATVAASAIVGAVADVRKVTNIVEAA